MSSWLHFVRSCCGNKMMELFSSMRLLKRAAWKHIKDSSAADEKEFTD